MPRLLPLITATIVLAAGAARGQTSWPGYSLAQTEVHPLRSQLLQRDYRLFVGLPDSYAREPRKQYPVLFVTDSDYAFPLLRSLGRRLGQQGRLLKEHILIGLSYADGDDAVSSRNRDYTPSPRRDGQGSSARYGEAEAYRRFIRDEVFPYVAAHLRADMSQRIYAGHSYGGLLGAHMLLSEPTMFQRYILSSPSLWYDDGLLLRRAADLAKSRRALSAQVLLLAGALETPQRAAARDDGNDIAGDLRRFERRLQGAPGLQIKTQLIPDEDHLSAEPGALTRGLRWALGI